MNTNPAPESEQLTPSTLLIFLDETGHEQFADPKHPVFGIGGCAIMSDEYVKRIQRPWIRLKERALGLEDQSFHAVDFEKSRPSLEKISAINKFMTRAFHRIAVTTDVTARRPNGFDGHETVSTVVFEYIKRLIGGYSSRRCMIFFEHSDRGNTLLERNLPIRSMSAVNLFSEQVDVSGYTIPKTAMEPGVEVADLIIHTAGKQQRKFGSGYVNGIRQFTPDFRAVFHTVDPSWIIYQSVASMEEAENDQLKVEHWPQL